MKTYIASPFFNNIQVEQVKSIENLLKNLDDEFYSPRLHGNFSKMKLDEKMSELAKSLIFNDNISQIKDSERVIVNLNGHRDIGTLFEFGVAVGLDKQIEVLIDKDNSETFDLLKDLSDKFPSKRKNEFYITLRSNLNLINSCKYIQNTWLNNRNYKFVVNTNNEDSYPLGIILLGYFYSRGNEVAYISNFVSKSNLMISESGIKQYKSLEDYEKGIFVDYKQMKIQ